MSDSARGTEAPRRTEAAVRTTKWPGWIWAVPLAAGAIVIWLLVRALSGRGTDVTVVFDEAAGMTANSTNVTYRGVDVGQVSSLDIAKDGSHVIARVTMSNTMKQDLRAGTRFYLVGAHPSFADLASLKTMLSGPVIELIPGPGTPTRHFVGIEGSPPEMLPVAVPYLVQLDGAVGNLRVGAPVNLRGFAVGDVTQVLLTYNAKTGRIATPVVVALDASRFHIEGSPPDDPPGHDDWTPVMNATIDRMVRQGLRARLTQTPPLIGPTSISLDFVPGATPAALETGGTYPEIPTVSGGGLDGFVSQVAGLPVEEIGHDLRAITDHLRALVASPALTASIDHLNRTLATLDTTVHATAPQIVPLVTQLRQTADEFDATAREAHQVAGGATAANGNLRQALRELTDAARAIREMANYIDQHPEALIRGRSP